MRYSVKERNHKGVVSYILTDHQSKTEAEIMPSVGNNLLRYARDGFSFISEMPDITQAKEDVRYYRYGSALLFPPNRVQGASFTFRGRDYQLPKNEDPNHLHGELCFKPWTVTETGADEEGCYLTSEFHFQDDDEILSYFPHPLTLRTTYYLQEGRLEARGEVINNGDTEAPYALGFHPYFSIPAGQKSSVTVSVPAKEEWPVTREAFVEGLPEKTAFTESISAGLPVSSFADLSCSLVSLASDAPARCSFTYPAQRRRLVYQVDPTQFPFLVIFKPDWSEALSLEPYSYVTDAFNLPWEYDKTGARGINPHEKIEYNWSLEVEAI